MTRALLFLCDERVQRLSAQAECFLNRVLEVFERYPTALDEHGRAPADPAQLRNLCYPHKPDIRHTHVERWLAEIELASLVTVDGTGSRRWLSLSDAGAEHARQATTNDANVSLLGRVATPLLEHGPASDRLIRNSDGLSPPFEAEIISTAAAATDSLDLIARLQPHFPRHDVRAELNSYVDWCAAKKPRAIVPHGEGFAKWMLRAKARLAKVRKVTPVPAPNVVQPVVVNESPDNSAQMDLFDEASHARFLAQLAERKARRSA